MRFAVLILCAVAVVAQSSSGVIDPASSTGEADPASSTGGADPDAASDSPAPAWVLGFFVTNCVWLSSTMVVLCVLACRSRRDDREPDDDKLRVFVYGAILCAGLLLGMIGSHYGGESQETDKVTQCIFFAMPCIVVAGGICTVAAFACSETIHHFRYHEMN